MVGLFERRPEHCEDRVADELVERAVVIEDDVASSARKIR